MNSLSRAPKQAASQRRQNILDGAAGVFAASSFARADTADLAAAAGVKAPALYRYFPTKRDLYLATLADAGPKMLELWGRALDAAPGPAEALHDIGMAYYDHAIRRSPVMRLWFQAVGEASDPEVREIVAETLGKAVALIERTLERGQQTGVFRPEIDTRATAWEFMGIGFSIDLVHVLGFDSDLTRQRVSDLGGRFIDSIRPAAHAPKAPRKGDTHA